MTVPTDQSIDFYEVPVPDIDYEDSEVGSSLRKL